MRSYFLRCCDALPSLGAVVLGACLLATAAGAQDAAPIYAVDGSYIKEWLVLGPFASDDLGEDLLASVGGEAAVEPRAGDRVVTATGDTLSWRRYTTRWDFVDLGEVFGAGENVTAYAYCALRSESAGEAGIELSSLNIDDDLALWLNGEPFGLEVRRGANRCLLKLVHGAGDWGFSVRLFSPDRAVVSGEVSDPTGAPVPFAAVRLERDGAVVAEVETDYWGQYELNVYPVGGRYDLAATAGTRGVWCLGFDLRARERLDLTHQLREAISLSGTLLMPDETTPHVAVPVQALRMGSAGAEVVATTLSDAGGRYQFINLKPGRYQVRCQVRGGYVYYAEADENATLTIEPGSPLVGIDLRFAPFKKGTWRTYSGLDGLIDSNVFAVHGTADGMMWFGTRSGISRYDGTAFFNLNRLNGLPNDWVNIIHSAPDGTTWLGSEGGAFRYDGVAFHTILEGVGVLDIEVADGRAWLATNRGAYRCDASPGGSCEPLAGLAGIYFAAVHRAADGALWWGSARGVYRYAGGELTQFTAADGLAADFVTAIAPAPDGALWFGTAGGLSRRDPRAGTFRSLAAIDGLVHPFINDIHIDEAGVVWVATDRGVSRYDGATCADADGPCASAPGTFVNYTTADGLADDYVWAIYADREGYLWFSTEKGGVSRYDEQTFVNYTTADGLVGNDVVSIYADRDGSMWFGTGYTTVTGVGVSRYDGATFTNYTTANGLAANTVHHIMRAADGALWLATIGGGLSRYDGETFETLNSADGLLSDNVESIHQDHDGTLWFGTGYITDDIATSGSGLSRYDGEEFVNFTAADGLPSGPVSAIHRSYDGALWLGVISGTGGLYGGVSRYDGETFTNFTTANGLGGNYVFNIYEDPDSTLWFSISGGGVSRYDGERFATFTTEDGLASNFAQDGLYRDRDGILWVGTSNGVSGYDGHAWTVLDTRDGLAGNDVNPLVQDAEGYLWFGTKQGVSRYWRSASRPEVGIDFAQSAAGRYRDLAALPPMEVEQRVTIGYRAIDFKTLPEKRQYRCRIREVDKGWRKPTHSTTFEWTPEAAGTYTFEVQAIDRDLNYSEPAQVILTVAPQYGQLALWAGLGLSLIGLVLAGGYGLRRRRERNQIREQLVRELEREMQTAHDLQMSLMPTQAPEIAGFDVAGRCLPATEVGGDFFQYFSQQDRFAVAVADVTGHGMQAAVPVMTFSGILNTEMKYRPALETLFAELNATLHQSLARRTFICFVMGEVDLESRVLRLSSCGLPYPLHYRAATGEVGELQVDAFPLGIRPRSTYEVLEVPLAPGDRVVFYSDGLVEAANAAGNFFGFARIAEAIGQGCVEGLSAANLLQQVFGEVRAFSGAVAQEDDQTLVVLHVEEQT